MFVYWLFVVLLVGCLIYEIYWRKCVGSRLPPGPSRWPVIGSIAELPPTGMPEYQHWSKHKDKYGPISSITVMGQTIVVLHDREAVHELMEKKSLKTSGRPWQEFGHKLCGYGKLTPMQQYNDTLRMHRRFIQQQFGTRPLIDQYNGLQEAEAANLLLRLLETPQDLFQHFKTQAAATILNAVYGYSIETSGHDPLFQIIEGLLSNLSVVFVPLTWSVDLLPILQYLPEWFPGAMFHAVAKKCRHINQTVADVPYTFVKERMARQTHDPSFVSRLVDQIVRDDNVLDSETEQLIKVTAASLYGGGSDTTVSSLSSFILAMLKFPTVQRLAQEEIDSVTGSNRLPKFEDRTSLPYVEAIVKEVFRWFPVGPMGLPHRTDEDVSLGGYLLPKGTILLPAVHSLLHDPSVYADPNSFDPTRYLPPRNEPDPRPFAFGFGRRRCPGQYFANSTAFITIAQILATFHIRKFVGSDGKEVEPEVKSVAGLTDRPADFPFQIIPRSSKHISMIEKAVNDFSQEKDKSGTDDSAEMYALLGLGA